MTSKIVVNNIEPDAGISTVSILGIATATKFIGDIEGGVTGNVTGNVTGSSGSCTGNAATATVASGITTTASVNTSGIVTATAFIPTTGQLSHRNKVINGAMNVAQRATTSTSSGYYTVDRFSTYNSGTDEAPTQAQVDVASGTTPYTLGFRKALKITNGNQTSGAGAGDYIWIQHVLEAQDIANSGWNYTSSSSYVTLSFWVKSSVAQEFKFYVRTQDGSNKAYAMTTGSLSADTWTKITKAIPGQSDLQFDNNNGAGFEINVLPFMGTDRTANSVVENEWQGWNASERMKDFTSTWYTTNDATFEYTGVQLEVGPVATPFEHRRWNEEYLDCCRYYQSTIYVQSGNAYNVCATRAIGSTVLQMSNVGFKTMMRSTPSVVIYNGTEANKVRSSGGGNITLNSPTVGGIPHGINYVSVSSGLTNGEWYQFNYTADAEI